MCHKEIHNTTSEHEKCSLVKVHHAYFKQAMIHEKAKHKLYMNKSNNITIQNYTAAGRATTFETITSLGAPTKIRCTCGRWETVLYKHHASD